MKRAVWLAAVVLAGALTVLCAIGTTVQQFAEPPDPHRRCTAAIAQPCLTREPGSVERYGSGVHEATVAFDDGVHTKTLDFHETPPLLHRAVVERWHGEIVAVVDPETERRYRTENWPVPFSDETFVPGLIGTLVLAGAFALLFETYRNRQRSK